MNCPHRGVRFDGTCDGCGARLCPPPATVITARIARCAHTDPLLIGHREAATHRWCRQCGAVQAMGVAAWLEPRSWVDAKELDDALRLGGLDALDDGRDSSPKNVIPIKPRT
jgi:hypothetical protein